MLERLQEVERRYEELLRLIGDPAVIADRREFAKLTRERAQLEEIVACLRERERVARDVAEHREVLGGADAELRELARSEMAAQHLRAIDRIVVRKGDDGHSRHLEAFIHVLWLVVGLPADSRQAGSVTHAGCDRVHMKVAAHAVIFGMRYEQPMKRSKILRQCAHGTY